MSLRIFALVWLALPRAGAPACAGECESLRDDHAALMQLTSRVRGVDKRAAPIQSTGRTLYSTNPAESANFIATYFNNATLVTYPACDHAARAAVQIQTFAQTMTYVFVKDTTVPGGHFSMDWLVQKSTQQATAVFNGSVAWSPWLDNHDGWGIWFLDCAKALEDKLQVLVYEDPSAIVRLKIPHTTYTLEFAGAFDEAKDVEALHALMHFAGVSDDPDLCRNNDVESSPTSSEAQLTWTKATFMSSNLTSAALWSTAVLSASLAEGAYPWPPEEGCEAAVWADVPPGLSLHFVLSSPYEEGMDPSIDAIAEDSEKTFLQEAVRQSQFEEYMYNSVIFEVSSLDPYLKPLHDNGFPFMFTQNGPQYILFAHIPGNDITIQLRSFHASGGDPIQLDMCTEAF